MDLLSTHISPQVESKTDVLLTLIDAATELRSTGGRENLDLSIKLVSVWKHIKDVDLPTLPEWKPGQ